MRTALTLAAALAFWLFVLVKFNAVRRRHHENDQGPIAVGMWNIAVLLGISLTLHVDEVQVAIGAWTGWNNVAWYVAYLFGVVAFHQIGTLSIRRHDPIRRKTQVLLTGMLVLVLAAVSLLYIEWIRWTPEWPARSPRFWADALFMVLFFGYAGVVSFIPLVTLGNNYRRHHARIMHLRTGLGLVTVLLAMACFWLKVAYALVGYWLPGHPLAEHINHLALSAMGGSALFFGPVMISHRTFARVTDLLGFGSKLTTLHDLRRLQIHLFQLCPPVIWNDPSWWEQMRDIDLYLYRTTISIMDSHKLLEGYLNRLERNNLSLLMIETDDEPLIWKEAEIRTARHIHRLLQVPPSADLEEVMLYYRHASRRLHQEQQRFSIRTWGLSATDPPASQPGRRG